MASHWQKEVGALSAFISYCWKERKEDVRELAKHLKTKKKMNIWIDEDEMHGSTVEQMAEGIDNSDAVIVFFCEPYQESKNCKREAEYADNRRKPILYVRLQEVKKGWLVMQMGDSLWVDFQKSTAVEDVAEEIVKQLVKQGYANVQTSLLLKAAANGHATIVDLLLDIGKVNVESCDDNGETAFWKACKYGHMLAAELLYSKYYANVDAKSHDGKTPLAIAIEREAEGNYNQNVIKFLQSLTSPSTA